MCYSTPLLYRKASGSFLEHSGKTKKGGLAINLGECVTHIIAMLSVRFMDMFADISAMTSKRCVHMLSIPHVVRPNQSRCTQKAPQ